jgi:predicted acyl esterase
MQAIRVPLTLFALQLVLSPFASAQEVRSLDVMVAMRDGVKLATTVYLPDGDGPWPLVLNRTPYDKAGAGSQAANWTNNGYVFAAQDCRGRFASEGDYVAFEHDMNDGYDSIEWLAAQDFSNGKIGVAGGSAVGMTANLAAAADPPHLVAAYVVVAHNSLFYQTYFQGGVFREDLAGGWLTAIGVGEQVPGFRARPVMDERWKKTDLVHHIQNIDIPMYNVVGWYDIFQQGGLDNFMALQYAGADGAQGNQKVLIGPTGHGPLSGDLEYPQANRPDEQMRWFDYWLKGEDNGIMDEPAVQYYMMASARKDAASRKNGWVEAKSWPPQSDTVRFFLQDGLGLSSAAPTSSDSTTTYAFDPDDPVPTFGGQNILIPRGPMDQRSVGERGDYLRFVSEPLEEDLIVAGKIDVELFAATDGPDTDFMVKLVDVYPDGYEALVVDAPIRARYRDGRRAEDVRMMQPGEAAKLDIDLWSVALTFEKGHRIAVHVTSSNFPRFAVNPNTGEAPGRTLGEPRIANNTVFHEADRASAILLPVVNRTD